MIWEDVSGGFVVRRYRVYLHCIFPVDLRGCGLS